MQIPTRSEVFECTRRPACGRLKERRAVEQLSSKRLAPKLEWALQPLFWTLLFVLSIFSATGQPAPELLDQARADLDAGRYALAIAKANQCSSQFRAAFDLKDLAASLRVVGLAQLYSGSYVAAAANLKEALDLARRLHDFGSEIARLNDLGTADYMQGRYRRALDYYEEADGRVKQVPNDAWSPWARQVTTANIAVLYQALGRYDRALELYSGLLRSGAALEPLERAQLLTNIGALRRRLGDPVKALETYRQAHEIYHHTQHAAGEIAMWNNIGIVQSMDFKDFKAAEASFSTAGDLARRTGDRPLEVQALLNRAEARYRAGHASLSRDDFEVASSRARHLGLREEEWRSLFGLAQNPETSSIDAHAMLLQAVTIIESLRADAASAQLRSHFLVDKRAVYDRLIAASTEAPDTFRWMEQSRARGLQDLNHAEHPMSLRELQRSLPADAGLLEYWVGRETAGVLWVSAKDTGVKRWKPDFGAIGKARNALADPHTNNWREAMEPLAAQLLSGIPILNDPNIRTLRIIPDGALALLPFEVLPLDSSKLLIERFAVSYAPSADLAGHKKHAPPRYRWPWQYSFAGLSDPGAWADEPGERTWAPLPRARIETEQAARITGGRTEVHSGRAANRAAVEVAARYPMLHLATHAQSDPYDPEGSFLLLAPASPQPQRYDYLFAREIRAMSFSGVDLVTLSACETNLGEFVPGEGVRGFAEAFLGSGARSVLNSLWTVGDVSTEELMIRFYSRLAARETAENALRLAKLDFIRHSESAHPAHWAAFVINGDANWKEPLLIGWSLLGAAAAISIATAVATAYALKSRKPGP